MGRTRDREGTAVSERTNWATTIIKDQSYDTARKGRLPSDPKAGGASKLVLKNTSLPFNDTGALLHLREIDDELVKADAKLIDALLKRI